LSRDLPGTGSKSGACGVSGTTGSSDFAPAAWQIAGQGGAPPRQLLRLRQNQTQRCGLLLFAFLIRASILRTPPCRSALARDLPGTGSKTGACGVSDTTGSSDFAAAARQIAGKRAPTPCRQKPSMKLHIMLRERQLLRLGFGIGRLGRSIISGGADPPFRPSGGSLLKRHQK
jgi:hypothetical protein